MRDSFVFYRSFYEAIKDLPRDIQGEVYTAIMEYSLNGITTENPKPIARSLFLAFKYQLDINNQRYRNGCNGGRPRKNETEQKPSNNQTVTKDKPNDNVNDNELNLESTDVDSLSTAPQFDAPDSINYKMFIDWFNSETNGIFGVVKYPLGEKRKASIRARVREHGRHSFFECLNKSVKSDFLKGQNNRGWVATLDWILKPANFEKILSGNYDNNRNNENNWACNQRNKPSERDISAAVELGIALAAGSNQ